MCGGYEVDFIATFQRLDGGCHRCAVVVAIGCHDVCFVVVVVVVIVVKAAAAAAAQYPLDCDMLQSCNEKEEEDKH